MKTKPTALSTYRVWQALSALAVYAVLSAFALVMLFPFMYMVATSLKLPSDTFTYPPRLLPRDPVQVAVPGYDTPLALYALDDNGVTRNMAFTGKSIPAGIFAPANNLSATVTLPFEGVTALLRTETINGQEYPLFDVSLNGQTQTLVQVRQTALGVFVDPADTSRVMYANVRLSQPIEVISAHPQNYADVFALNNFGRALTNTTLVTMLVVVGQLFTSVAGGYAFARLRFPGRDTLFVLYLGTIMIPFVLLIIPLYQLMVLIGWQDRMAALVIPWVFTAYGTFLMRQHFITIPREIEEAAVLDGASRFDILWRVFIPASVPALATLATFTFLYAWNSFFWPLVIINTGNTENHVLTLALNILRGRAADSPNLILAGAAIAVLAPFIIFVFAQRYYIESVTSSGVKG